MIESLRSPHVARVKALLSSKKERKEQSAFIAEGLQSVREAIQIPGAIETLYLSPSGTERLAKAGIDLSADLQGIEIIEVAQKVSDAMSDAISAQGIVAICKDLEFPPINPEIKHLIYLNEIQDPGNAGTILRTADAFGISALATSPGSVDFYSPKVVRATAGSLWHVRLYQSLTLDDLCKSLPNHKLFLLDGASSNSIDQIDTAQPAIWIFGNEARGLSNEIPGAKRISIPMAGRAESLNLAAAAAIVIHEISRR